MERKKKHIANRHPADALNDGLRFDEQLKAKKAAQKAKTEKLEKERTGNSSSERKD